jgi:hypothetical protein
MFDPSADDNRAIRQAAMDGQLAVVERLLQDERVDPSANNNEFATQNDKKRHKTTKEFF